MTLKIYNTWTRQKETFKPIEPNKVKMYVCGPTVYDYIHIGNARPTIFFDVVRRYLTALGYEVTYVVNITDIDDKMIRKAETMNTTVPDIAEIFIKAYMEDMKALGLQSSIHPRVMDNMPEIIEFITELMDIGCAYESDKDVYFRTDKFENYGKLSRQNLEELQLGIRVEVDERKHHPFDFVLWKQAKPGEISWSSPWGEGRPGWHIECSAMVRKYLGNTIDIHGGGQDLQFPHHECEVAQTESLTGQPMANFWMHNGYININNAKMSKSLGNGLNVRELVNNVGAHVVRYFILSGHYRNPLNYSDEVILQVKGSLERLNNCFASVKHRLNSLELTEANQANQTKEEQVDEQLLIASLQQISEYFTSSMDNDFNTADAITAMFDLVKEANLYLKLEQVSYHSLSLILAKFTEMNAILGILHEQKDELLDEEVEQLIKERTEARSSKNWARADEVRDILTKQNILLEDTPQGLRWRRK